MSITSNDTIWITRIEWLYKRTEETICGNIQAILNHVENRYPQEMWDDPSEDNIAFHR